MVGGRDLLMRSPSLLSGMVLEDESSSPDLNLLNGFPSSLAGDTVLKACGTCGTCGTQGVWLKRIYRRWKWKPLMV